MQSSRRPQHPFSLVTVEGRSTAERLRALHDMLLGRYPFIHRIAIALYDPATDGLKTFASSNEGGAPLTRYEARLADVPSLRVLAEGRRTRVVHDIDTAFDDATTHTQWLRNEGFRSSYTIPIYSHAELAGFLFVDSRDPAVFQPEVTRFLDIFGELTAQLYLVKLAAARSLIGAVHIACRMASIRDTETGMHLERMAKYSRLIARQLNHYGVPLSDEFVEYVHLFAPLHDIGKVGVPDRILLQPGRLDRDGWSTMQGHVELGVQMVDEIAAALGMLTDDAATIMRNIVGGHHERGDGSGYPLGLERSAIPIEARIVAVADAYDALTSRRAYKEAWPHERAVEQLRQEAATGQLDPDCVHALLHDPEALAEIRARFPDQG